MTDRPTPPASDEVSAMCAKLRHAARHCENAGAIAAIEEAADMLERLAAMPREGEVERLVALVLGDDHKRLCEGREYTCTCGYDVAVYEAAAALGGQHD